VLVFTVMVDVGGGMLGTDDDVGPVTVDPAPPATTSATPKPAAVNSAAAAAGKSFFRMGSNLRSRSSSRPPA
jgi:hypothetical protein